MHFGSEKRLLLTVNHLFIAPGVASWAREQIMPESGDQLCDVRFAEP